MTVSQMIEWLKTQDQEAIVKVIRVSDADSGKYGRDDDCYREHHYVFQEIFDAHPDEYSETIEGSFGYEKTYLLLGKEEY